MGRLMEVLPGKDNCVRVVKVKTGSGELIRPVQRLHPLEVDCNSELFDSEAFKRVKVNNCVDETRTEDKDVLDDELCRKPASKTVTVSPGIGATQDSIQTRCGRTVKLPRRYED
ncbi:hypothetical protein JTE90_014825 [Oedothorax gibbosus]|uniref:DUF5641 domain-containing protein n=1 Tax=Oedothorax gibbosus TaxID=931172 RepID=A0AAV6UCF1_9ARAC|nr:hypothetical protein JTE90_014825 [Oedothorax gibbosus]